MGNSVSRVVGCFMPVGNEQERVGLVFSEPLDEGLGHSFCYVRPVIESARYSPSQSDRFGILDPEGLESWENNRSFRFTEDNDKCSNPSVNPNANLNPKLAETTFKAISGASVSANTSTPRTVVAAHDHATTFANPDRASAFEGTSSFSALPLQPVPRGPNGGGGSFSGPMSGPLQQQTDRSFMSAPLERGGGFLSGPLERGAFLSGPLENMDRSQYFSAPLGGTGNHMTLFRRRRRYLSRFMRTVSKPVRSVISRTQRSWVLQLVGWQQSKGGGVSKENATYDSGMFPSEDSSNNNLQWAQGKAGEDRVHVVLSEEHGWLFVGIYDGFNGPDAPEFLMCNLYKAIFNELEGLLWDRKPDCADAQPQQQDSAKPQECPHAQSGHQNLTHPVEDCHCPHAQSGQSNQDNPLKDCHCPHAQSATQANTIHSKHPEAVKRYCPDAQSAPGLNNPNHSQAPEASQEDSHHSEEALQNPEVTRENSSHALSAFQLNPEATQEDQSALQSNPDHSHCRKATKQDSSPAQYRTKQNGNDPGSQNAAHSPARQNHNDLQDPDVKDADLEVGDRNTSTSQQEELEVDARQHPSNEIDNEDPEGNNRETSIEVSRTDPKVTSKQGDARPLTEFIKRVTFECEKKGVGECRKGRSLRELLAEEEDDPFDIFLWNSSTNMIHRSRQDSSSGSVVATAGASRLVSEGSVETREGNGASDQIADTRGRRVGYSDSEQKQGRGRSLLSSKLRQAWRKESHRKLFPWRYDWEKERIEVEKKLDEGLKQDPQRCKAGSVDHVSVLKALSRALEVTEEAYLEMTDKVLDENPELALMGSCLLVMLMKDQDVYVMNVGDSRAIVAQQRPGTNSSAGQHCSYQNGDREERVGLRDSLVSSELEGITEEPSAESVSVEANTNTNANGTEAEMPVPGSNLIALQLSTDHSTSIEEEVLRIKAEHPDDSQSILNDRVKGRLKVTRAFGAGFLKQPKWNDALLEMFRNDYIGTAPYITCTPSLRHHRLGPNDQFLVLSSDGLYQYLSNQEVVSHVELFMEKNPEADPAQHLIEELLFRAAKKAGMNFRELLDIPQGDRRKYHDDVTVMVISLEGRIWKSSGKYI